MELPFLLMRTDKKEYLEELQSGKLFMRNMMYYQSMSSEDVARMDCYDGSVPSGKHFVVKIPASMGEFKSQKITQLDCYIKSFFEYTESDVKKVSESTYEFSFSIDAQRSLSEFNTDYAIIIVAPFFLNRFFDACERSRMVGNAGTVHYLSDDEYAAHELAILNAIMDRRNGVDTELPSPLPMFCKPQEFRHQQEYRLCLNYKSEKYLSFMGRSAAQCADKEDYNQLAAETYTMDIGSIADISCIVPVSQVLNYPIRVVLRPDGNWQLLTKAIGE